MLRNEERTVDAGGDPSAPRISFREHLRAWLAIGSQSVGGGAATLFLMRQILVRKKGWLTDAEFSQDWTLSKTSPGLTLMGLTALLGKRIDGWRGLVTALAGLLVPSVTVTLAITVGFAYIRDQPQVQAALRGIAPATIGLTLAMMVIFARSSMRNGRSGWIDGGLVAFVILVATIFPDESIPIIVAGAFIGWLALGEITPPVTPIPADGIVNDGRED